jgi:WD40 repeat protein
MEDAMIRASGWFVFRRSFERVRRLTGEAGRLVSRRGVLRVIVRMLALVPAAVRLRAAERFTTIEEPPSDLMIPPGARPPLQRRALLQVGTDDLRMQNIVVGIAFSPDGRLIAVAAAHWPAPRVAIFDVQTGRRVEHHIAQDGRTDHLQCLAFSADMSRLLWGDGNGQVGLWDLAGGRPIFREKLHDHPVTAVGFSPDGGMIASASEDAVRLRWVAKPAEVLRDLTTRPVPMPGKPGLAAPEPSVSSSGAVRCLAFSPDGTRLVAGTATDATLFVWRIPDGQLLRQIPAAHRQSGTSMSAYLNCVSFSPDGRRVFSSGPRAVPGPPTPRKPGSRQVSQSEVRFWDLETGECVQDLHGDEDYGFGYAALSRDGRRVAVADFRVLRILDAATGKAEQTISLPRSMDQPPVFSPDGSVVALPLLNTAALYEVRTGRRLHHDERTPVGEVMAAAWSPSGDRIVTGHADGIVRVWEAATGKLLWNKLLARPNSPDGWNGFPAFVTFSRDGQLVVVAGRRDDPIERREGIIAIYEAGSGLRVREVYQRELWRAALAPDDRMVVVGTSYGSDGDTHFVGVEIGTGRTRWANPPQDQRAGFRQVVGMQFHANSPSLEVALKDGNVIRFNALTGHEQRRFLADGRTPEQRKAARPGRPDLLFTAGFDVDGRTLVSSSGEGLCVWDVESGTLRRRIRDPYAHRSLLILAPDGKTLATSIEYAAASDDNRIRLYDIETGDPALALEPGNNMASVLAFSPDGARLFSGFHSGSGMVWEVRRGEKVHGAK